MFSHVCGTRARFGGGPPLVLVGEVMLVEVVGWLVGNEWLLGCRLRGGWGQRALGFGEKWGGWGWVL